MLQQTQVETVLRYYEPFLQQFPSIDALARAPLGKVLKAWEGMGYYARCRNLHKAAGICMAQHDGCFPEAFDDALALPGIGRSTAGAILTFGHGQSHAILDANVKRVLARLYNIDGNLPALWDAAETLLAGTRRPFDYGQAMMELGALVCSPRKPDCAHCPVRRFCEAEAAGTQHLLPRPKARKPLPHRELAVGLVLRRGRLLLLQRPLDGLLGGLWEPPGGQQRAGETLEETVRRSFSEELGLAVVVGGQFATVRHAFTHFKITMHAFECRVVSGTARPRTAPACRWVTPRALDDYALPRASQRVLEAWQARP